ncbi:MAG: Glycosyltransferase, AglL family [Candidatus Methanohalarchaeum thermophilum]|uniref:Glycosyltransferase, AglL family n=1 Tax=Methanohalarchaeum thermophilum TaxID=1903181 RepID=A0A1Q6DSP6_METT1|nr:MAG: Glycosyltransferase, AglL family [Candidatus Methanohalarchaeum thermophilum]
MIEIIAQTQPNKGGLGRLSYNMYKSIDKLGYDVTYYAFENEIPSYFFSDLIFSYQAEKKIDRDSILIGFMGQNYFASEDHNGRYYTICGDVRPFLDKLHQKGLMEFTNLKEKLNHIINDFGNNFLIDLHKHDLEISEKIIVPSSFVKNQLKYYNSEFGKKSVIYPHGVDKKLFSYKRKNSGDFILFVGGVSNRKGINDLIEALNRLKEIYGSFKSKLVGYGNWSKIKKLVKDKDLEENIDIEGYVSDKRLYELYSNAKVLILPSYSEGFGIPVVEAMAVGVPIIISENVGAKDLVRESGGGKIVKPGEINQISNYLKDFLENRSLNKKYGRKNRKLVSEKYTWKKTTKRLLEKLNI